MGDFATFEDPLGNLQRWNVEVACIDKARYCTEVQARSVGGRRATEARIDLWVYQCSFCAGWHLTSGRRPKHWHVHTRFRADNCYEAVNGDPLFWERLVGMDPVEAETLLRRLKTEVVAALDVALPETRPHMVQTVSRINEELHIISEQANRELWKTALRNIFGQEGADLVRDELRRLSHERSKKGEEHTR